MCKANQELIAVVAEALPGVWTERLPVSMIALASQAAAGRPLGPDVRRGAISFLTKQPAPMTPRPLRMPPGVDLRRELERLVSCGQIGHGFVIAGIGSICDAVLRFANDEVQTTVHGSHEILTLSGSLSENGAHLHITVAGPAGTVLGGHVCYGNTVRTTAEILLVETPDWNLRRVGDEITGYKELSVTPTAGAVEASPPSAPRAALVTGHLAGDGGTRYIVTSPAPGVPPPSPA